MNTWHPSKEVKGKRKQKRKGAEKKIQKRKEGEEKKVKKIGGKKRSLEENEDN